MNFANSKEMQRRSHRIIPGGAHTYAKGDDQFPELAPGFIARGQGCHVWDVDGNEFIEYGMGLRAVTLGHAYPRVVEAAYQQMLLGINFTRPSPIEVECAEKLLSFLPNAEMVKFSKDGSTITSAAVKLARAHTGKDMVAMCVEHPFFSYDDWFIGTTPIAAGIPEAIRGLSLTFHYNDLSSLESLFQSYPEQIACVVMEAMRTDEPAPGFLPGVQKLCRDNGALFVLDEMITGFRWHRGGAQAYFGLDPDLSAFGKAMANGFALSALVGRRDIMELGGLFHDRERVFLLSTTHGAENHALAASVETMNMYDEEPVIEHLYRQGERLAEGFKKSIESHGLCGYVEVVGNPTNLIYATRDSDKQSSQALRTLFLQETIRRGVIAPSLVVSYSHTDADIDRTIEAIDGALGVYRQALEDGADRYLVGPSVKSVYRRFN